MPTGIKTWVLVFGITGQGAPVIVPDYGTFAECSQAVVSLIGWMPKMYAKCIPGPVK